MLTAVMVSINIDNDVDDLALFRIWRITAPQMRTYMLHYHN